ncbi:hypothetical protein GCM10009560_63160 [Nonomuraea longicatena]|uniref:Uncharacterized protein n=1 Tax=Nonomuraea longicatena TaxID=83682 RepID=A0ABN1QSX3_9ACTN
MVARRHAIHLTARQEARVACYPQPHRVPPPALGVTFLLRNSDGLPKREGPDFATAMLRMASAYRPPESRCRSMTQQVHNGRPSVRSAHTRQESNKSLHALR